jgi:hypothetical protein
MWSVCAVPWRALAVGGSPEKRRAILPQFQALGQVDSRPLR